MLTHPLGGDERDTCVGSCGTLIQISDSEEILFPLPKQSAVEGRTKESVMHVGNKTPRNGAVLFMLSKQTVSRTNSRLELTKKK